MGCGTKIDGRYVSFSEREEITRKLEDDGEYRLARLVKYGDCLGYSDLHRAEDVLGRQGVSRNFDYKEERCRCAGDEEEDVY